MNRLIAPIFLCFFTFFLPLSPSLKSIFWILAVLSILLTPAYRRKLAETYTSSWGLAALALFGFVLLACFWSPAPYTMRWQVLEKYTKLLALPILVVGLMDSRVRHACLNSYLAAMGLTAGLSILKSIYPWGDPDPGAVFYNHIVTGWMMALACYFSGLFVFITTGRRRLIYLLLGCLMSYQLLFVNTGRTGYLLYFTLMLLLLVQQLSIKKACLYGLLFITGIFLVYQGSTTMRKGAHDLMHDLQALQHHEVNHSVGFRLQFHQYAQSLFAEHPFIGIGTGGFKYRFSRENPIPAWGDSLTEPHSQYWMILAEQGLIGFLLLICFLGSLLKTSFRMSGQGSTKAILWGVLAAFSLACLSDTLLCYSPAGYLLLLFSGLCFGTLTKRMPSLEASESILLR